MSLADEMRKLTNETNIKIGIDMVNRYYDKVVNKIENKARNGEGYLFIDDSPNEELRDLIRNNEARNELTKRLEKNGFKITYSDGNYWDDSSCSIKITW